MEFLKRWFSRKPRAARVDIRRRFDLIGRVGQGSMSKVWRARDTLSGREVCLKVLDKVKTFRLDKRFVGMKKPTEGEIAIGLKHRNIAKTLEFGLTTDDEQYLVLEFVEGVGLSFLVERQNDRMKSNRLWYLVQLGDAIAYMHEKQWIHRDLCPRNVMVDDEDVVKLIDFGLVVPDTEPFRAPGNRTGTVNYMAPELIARKKTDQRIDTFSFAVTCFEAYTKALPWPSSDTMEAAMQRINASAKDIRKLVPRIDPQVANAIMKGLEKDPQDRWRTMRLMVNELRAAGERLGLIPEEPAVDDAEN